MWSEEGGRAPAARRQRADLGLRGPRGGVELVIELSQQGLWRREGCRSHRHLGKVQALIAERGGGVLLGVLGTVGLDHMAQLMLQRALLSNQQKQRQKQ